MPRQHEIAYALNAGGVDPKAVARIDLEKMRLAGEHPVANLLPEVLGPCGLRPGTEMLGTISAETRQFRMLRATGTSYLLLMSPGEMRVSLNGAIQQVPAVATRIGSAWTDASASGASVVQPGEPLGLLLALTHSAGRFFASSTAMARMRQTVTVAPSDQNTEHVLRIVVSRGPVYLRVGTTAGGAELMPGTTDAELGDGTHKIAFTPGTGTIYVEVSSVDEVERVVETIQFESAYLVGGTGDLVLPTPWATIADVDALRMWQSIDVMFVGDGVYRQRRIEHRGPLSWSIALFKTSDGPFVAGNSRITMTPAARLGNTTVTASDSYFQAGHVGALIELTQTGKTVTSTFDAADQASDYITVVGIDNGRIFYRTGVDTSFIGTIVLERSFEPDQPSVWTTVATYTNGAATFSRTAYDDGQDNLTAHYRFRVSAYTSGSVDVTLEYDSQISTGVARITAVTSTTSARVEVLKRFGKDSATRQWRIGDWSDLRGWPRVPVIHDGRLHWFRFDTDYASEPDNYDSHDDTIEGDGSPLVRSVGAGGESGVLWAWSGNRLLAGTQWFEAVIAASEFDSPLTPTEYTVRKPSTRGSADIAAAEHDDGVFFVQRSRKRLMDLSMVRTGNRFDSQNISRLNPAAYAAGIKRLAVQQQPDTRVYAVMDDGTLTVLTFEREDEVAAITWIGLDDATIEDVEVLPETDQDDVYLIVNRSGTRYHERFAKEAAQSSVATCALLDAHKVLTGSVSQITGATHLAGQTVQVWADGQRRADVTLNGSGVAALGAAYSRVVYGKRYTATFKTVKLAYAAGLGTPLGQTKIVKGAGLILANSCLDGIQIGPDADHLDPMPMIINGAVRTENQFFEHYDQDILPINSDWTPDARFYVQVDSAEGPVTMQAIVFDVETRDGSGNA